MFKQFKISFASWLEPTKHGKRDMIVNESFFSDKHGFKEIDIVAIKRLGVNQTRMLTEIGGGVNDQISVYRIR